MKPLPLASKDLPRPGQVWVHANGVCRLVLAVDGAWVRYRNALSQGECNLKEWRAWAMQARLVRQG